MKRYDITFNCYDSCGAVEHSDGEYVLHSESQERIEALEEELLEEREGRGRGSPDLLTTAYMSGAQDYRATVRQLHAKIEALEWLVEVYDLYMFMYEDSDEKWLTDAEENAIGELELSCEAARAAVMGE